MEGDHELEKFEHDDVFSQFLKEDFHVKVFASQSLQGALVSELLAKLASGISILDKELLNQVSTHYEDLLSQATGIETLESVLAMMQVRIQALLSAVERLRAKLLEPYNKIASQTAMLARLQTTCDLLRKIVRISYLTKRLHGQLQGGIQEITKAAQSLNELDYLLTSGDISGIDVIERDQQLIRQARKEVERQAEQMMSRGMETQNQTHVATALQVFHNLGLLVPMVERYVETLQTDLEKNVRDALDVAALSQSVAAAESASTGKAKVGPGRAAMPAVGSAVAFRATLWTNIERLTTQIQSSCAKALQLQRILAKKRDPLTHVCFLDELAKSGGENILPGFWDFVTRILEVKFNETANASTSIKQAFEGEYPKLLRNFADLWRHLQHFNNGGNTGNHEDSPDGGNGVGAFDPETALRSTLSEFENAYLSRSLSRLFDPINIMFGSEGTPPSNDEANGVARIMSSELSFASVDSELYNKIAGNVGKTVKLFTTKCEEMLCTDGEASQVISPATHGQEVNVKIVNLAFHFQLQVGKVVQSLVNAPPEACDIITRSLELLTNLTATAVHPLLKSVGEAIEDIILTMHNEDYSQSGNSGDLVPDAPCSLYMKELEAFIARSQSQYFSQFQAEDFIFQYLHPLACRSIELLVRHVGLVRPLGSSGKMRLAADLAQMESAITPLCRRVGELGKAYRLLRAFRPLLFQTPEHIMQSPSLGETIPYGIVLQFLYSKGPSELQSPHQIANWSIARYSQWLDEHSERECLHLIQGSLEAYTRGVKQRGDKEYTHVYPTMLQILQRAIQFDT